MIMKFAIQSINYSTWSWHLPNRT